MEDDAVLFLRKPLFSALSFFFFFFLFMLLNGMEMHLHLVLVWCLLMLMFMFMFMPTYVCVALLVMSVFFCLLWIT